MRKTNKTYLGDGVYASFDGWDIVLTTMRDDGEAIIYLDSAVWDKLQTYVERIADEESEQASVPTEGFGAAKPR